jgi:hypothetical protein
MVSPHHTPSFQARRHVSGSDILYIHSFSMVRRVKGSSGLWSKIEAEEQRTMLIATRLLHRAWQIFNKPLSELISVLGLDIPPAPRVSLAGITADQIQLQWPAPGNPSQVSKYFIQVNGVIGKLGPCVSQKKLLIIS